MNINIEWRKWYHFTANQVFEFIINICVVVSIALLVIDDPLGDPRSVMISVLRAVDIFITLVFFVEAFIKIVALGFVNSQLKGFGMGAYLSNAWNVVDFLVLLTTIFYLQQ